MKSWLKKVLVKILGSQVRRLRRRNDFKIIGVAGSIGKTSTKLAIAKILQAKYRMRYQEGNYNDLVSVPFVFFGQTVPAVWNILAWLKVLIINEIKVWSHYPFDFVVVELGTDGPGQISQFRDYLRLDVAVLTAITPEHMQFFENIEAVATEEWSISFFSDWVLVNKDLCLITPENIDHKKNVFYGTEFGSVYKIQKIARAGDNLEFEIYFEDKSILNIAYSAISEVELYSITAAIILALKFKMASGEVVGALKNIFSFAGRMQRLVGVKDSVIIDDTYNASPEAVLIALDALYTFPRRNKVAILGMMNELGKISEIEHRKIGKYCDPKILDLVVTIGKDANHFLAPEARQNGCRVYEAKDAKDAGQYVFDHLKEDSVILAKGSQNGVFAEEALKPLLANKADVAKLVRQSDYWMSKK